MGRDGTTTYRPINKRIRSMRPHALHKPRRIIPVVMKNRRQRLAALELDLAVCPAWDFNDGIDNGRIILVRVQRHVMPERDRLAFVQQPDPPIESVAGADFAEAESVVVEFGGGAGGVGAGCVIVVEAFAGWTRRFGEDFVFGEFGWVRRRSGIYCCSQSGN